MSVDLSQFHQVFFEESFEGLDIMESELLDMDPADVDDETVNNIFRAAHSIKGGAGTFGFMPVSEFTHVLETLLDEIRSGKRSMEPRYVDLFLQSVDCLRGMLSDMQDGNDPEKERPAELRKEFEVILGMEQEAAATEEAVSDSDEKDGGWLIDVHPHTDLLMTGNEPFRMFRELRELVGEDNFEVTADTDNIPELSSLTPEECVTNWQIKVTTSTPIDDIKAIFEWVEDECDLTYSPLTGAVEAVSEDQDQQSQETSATASEESPGQAADKTSEKTPVVAEAQKTAKSAKAPKRPTGPALIEKGKR